MSYASVCLSERHSTALQASIAICLILATAPMSAGDPPKGCPDDPSACPTPGFIISKVTIITLNENGGILSECTYQVAPTGSTVTILLQPNALLFAPSDFIVIGVSN
jgi:hypothetical protein